MGRIKTSALALAFLATASCKPKQGFELSTTAYVMGPVSQIVPVDSSSEGHIDPNVLGGEVLIATLLADKTVKFCSGSLVAEDKPGNNYRVLTNHHCFAKEDAQGNATKDLLPEACVATQVHFGFIAGQTEESIAIDCQTGTLRTNFNLDLGTFTLAQNPPEKYKPIALWDGDDAETDRPAMIVHYPDIDASMVEPPGGGAKLPTASVTLANCSTEGAFPQSEWSLDRALPFGLRHTCDLIHGSSGSGLIDVATGMALGVNWGGIKISEPSGLNTYNVATRAKFAAAFLANTADDLVALTLATQSQPAPPAPPASHGVDLTKGNLIAQAKGSSCATLGRPREATVASALAVLSLLAAPAAVASVAARARRRPRGMRQP